MIKISKKWDYILKAIIFLASNKNKVYKIQDIALKLNIPLSLLRKLLNDSEKNNIIKSIKWRNWWVFFDRDLKEVSVYDILFSIKEDLNISNCSWWIPCSNIENCNTTKVFLWLQKWFTALLKLYTLDKIIKENEKN